MGARFGRDVVIKMDDGTGTFVVLAGIRQASMKLSDGNSDVSSADSPGAWQELLAGTGMMKFAVSGQAVIKSSVIEKKLLANKLARAQPDFQMIIPGLGMFQGAHAIGDLEYAGNHDGEATYNVSFDSAEELAFTAE